MLRVDSVQLAPFDGSIVASAIDVPAARTETHHVLELIGSVVTKRQPISDVRVMCGDDEVARAVIGVPRPDLAERFPDVPNAGVGGFQASLSGIDLPLEWAVDVVATLDEKAVPIAKIQGSRDPVQSTHTPKLQPVLLLTMGRTGSIWATYLLSRHPQLVAYRPFDFEPRMSWYWMSVLKTLVRPYSYLRPISPGLILGDPTWWAGLERPEVMLPPEQELREHFDRGHFEAVATLCHSRLDAFYTEVALMMGKKARAYVEKLLPIEPEYRLLLEIYPAAKRIVLVRDLRDVFCSVHDFGQRRGKYGQGRQLVQTADEYVAMLARNARQWAKETKKGGFLLRYEDLIRDPKRVLEPMLGFIGVDASRRVIDTMCAEATATELPQMTTHRTSPSVEASIGRWRRDLDPEIRKAIEREAGDAMRELGYDLEG